MTVRQLCSIHEDDQVSFNRGGYGEATIQGSGKVTKVEYGVPAFFTHYHVATGNPNNKVPYITITVDDCIQIVIAEEYAPLCKKDDSASFNIKLHDIHGQTVFLYDEFNKSNLTIN